MSENPKDKTSRRIASCLEQYKFKYQFSIYLKEDDPIKNMDHLKKIKRIIKNSNPDKFIMFFISETTHKKYGDINPYVCFFHYGDLNVDELSDYANSFVKKQEKVYTVGQFIKQVKTDLDDIPLEYAIKNDLDIRRFIYDHPQVDFALGKKGKFNLEQAMKTETISKVNLSSQWNFGRSFWKRMPGYIQKIRYEKIKDRIAFMPEKFNRWGFINKSNAPDEKFLENIYFEYEDFLQKQQVQSFQNQVQKELDEENFGKPKKVSGRKEKLQEQPNPYLMSDADLRQLFGS